MGSPGQCTSIFKFLQQHHDKQIVLDVYCKWKDMLQDIGFDEQFRRENDQWFFSCYRADFNKFSNGMVAVEKSRMFDMLKNSMSHEPKLYLQYIENKFGGGESVIDAARRCVWREEQLLGPFIQSVLGDASSINRQEQAVKTLRDSYETCLANSEKLKAVFAAALALTKEETRNSTKVTDYKNKMEDLSQRLPHNVNRDRVEQLVQKLQKECNELESANQKFRDQISLKQQESLHLFDVLLQTLTDNNDKLLDAVTEWRNQFKMFYAELGSKPDLEKIAKCCAESAKLLFDIKQDGLAQLTHASSEENCRIQKTLDYLLLELFRGTFVVVEQDNYVIKKKSENLKIIVRVLAADLLEHMLDGHIQAFLVHEEGLNQCCEQINDSTWLFHIDRVEQKSLKLVTKKKGNAKGAESRFIRNKKTEPLEGEFSGLQVEKFDRAGLKRQVHEERYNIVFVTNVGQEKLWTLSLPLVMITGSNQEFRSLASVMWACYSTNVYTLPSVVPNEMLIGDIVDRMLDAKIRKLCPSRGLSDDSKEHLKKRLIGSDNVTDETKVSLKRFCYDEMINTADSQPLKFSFWEWFVACCNLIAKYLLPYWERGWIVGFISKTTAKEKLAAEKRCCDGLFLLRFSDNIIARSQAVKSMFGHLTVCFTSEKVIPDGNVADFKQLDMNCLANRLSKAVKKQGLTHCYRYVYPSLERREDTFDTLLESKPVVANYQDVQPMWIIDIEQMLSEETVLGKRTASTETDSPNKRSVTKKTNSSRTKSADTNTSCIGNQSSFMNATPPVLEGTFVQHTPPPAIPFLPEILEFSRTPDNSSLDCTSNVISDDYGEVPTEETYHQLNDSTVSTHYDCMAQSDVSEDVVEVMTLGEGMTLGEEMTLGEFTGTKSSEFNLYDVDDDKDTDGLFQIPEHDLKYLNI